MANVPTAVAISQPSSGLGLIADLLLAYDRKLNKPSTLQRLKDARDPAEFLRLARTVVPPLQDEPAIAPDGTAWFPADLGQLRRRSPQGQWDNLGIDTLRQILAVEYDNGRLVVGSDDGQLRASDDGGHAWKQLRSLGAGESVIDIDRVGTDGGFREALRPLGYDPVTTESPAAAGAMIAAETPRWRRLVEMSGARVE